MAVEARELPLEALRESGAESHPMWQGMGHFLVDQVAAGNAQLQTLADIRAQQGSAKDKLSTSDNPEAITYREWSAKGESKKSEIDAEFNPQIKVHQDAIAELRAEVAKRKKLIDTKLGEQQQKAIEAITADTKVDLDVDGALATYKAISDQVNAMVKMFLDVPTSAGGGDVFAPLKGFRLPGPGVASGALKVAKGSGAGSGARRFRWGTVFVDSTELSQPTTKEIAKAAGSQQEEHFKTALLSSLNGTWDNLPREGAEVNNEPHVFEWNGHRISVILRASKPAATETPEAVAA